MLFASSDLLTGIIPSFSDFAGFDPKPIANQIKGAGHKLMTTAVVRSDEGAVDVIGLLELASDGYAFRTDDVDLITNMTNAFCRGSRYACTVPL